MNFEADYYEQKYQERVVKHLKRKTKSLGLGIVEVILVSGEY